MPAIFYSSLISVAGLRIQWGPLRRMVGTVSFNTAADCVRYAGNSILQGRVNKMIKLKGMLYLNKTEVLLRSTDRIWGDNNVGFF